MAVWNTQSQLNIHSGCVISLMVHISDGGIGYHTRSNKQHAITTSQLTSEHQIVKSSALPFCPSQIVDAASIAYTAIHETTDAIAESLSTLLPFTKQQSSKLLAPAAIYEIADAIAESLTTLLLPAAIDETAFVKAAAYTAIYEQLLPLLNH